MARISQGRRSEMIPTIVKSFLSKLILFLVLITPVWSEDSIELYIDGQKYVRDYPQTMTEARELINSLVYINNNFDKTFMEYQARTQIEEQHLLTQIDALEVAHQNLKNQSAIMQDELNKVSRALNQKSSLLLFGSVGIENDMQDNQLGQVITVGFAHQTRPFNLFTCYLGLMGNTTIYYHLPSPNKVQDIGIGLYFGIFID
jgi:hypothetical protein